MSFLLFRLLLLIPSIMKKKVQIEQREKWQSKRRTVLSFGFLSVTLSAQIFMQWSGIEDGEEWWSRGSGSDAIGGCDEIHHSCCH